MKKLIVLTVLLFTSLAWGDVVILIPKVLPPVKIVDIENPTQEELAKKALKESRDLNFAPIKNWLENNVEFTGVYEELINHNKASSWIKDNTEYMLFVLQHRRLKPNKNANKAAMLGGLNALHSLGKEIDFAATDDVIGWLGENGYTRPEVSE
ncbi:hypothetical protein LCGC14_2626110 [marine sediment metagenome]|uniref:Uncharacterized protein n=1 Tax=marine sediment metagenome TaxID=412755 RepID=A0A0F9AP91_9ZZZZ